MPPSPIQTPAPDTLPKDFNFGGGAPETLPSNFNFSGGPSPSASTDNSSPSLLQSLTRSLWSGSGLAKFSASAIDLGARGVKDVAEFTGHKDAAEALNSAIQNSEMNGFDMGSYGGKSTPINSFMDGVGAAAKLGSFFVTAPESLGAKAGAIGAESPILSGFLSKALPWLVKSSPFAALQGLSAGVDSGEKGSTVGGATKDAAINYGMNLGVLGLFEGAGNLIKWAGGKMIASDAVKMMGQKMTQFGDIFQKTLEEGANPRDMKALEQGYGLIHSDAVDAVGEAIKQPQTDGSLWQKIGGKVNSVVNTAFSSINDAYKGIYRPDVVVGREAMNATDKAVSDAAETFRPGAGATAKVGGFVQTGSQHLDLMLGDIYGMMKKGGISLQDIGELWRNYGLGASNPIENKQMQNILHAVTSDAKGYLGRSASPEEKALLEQWNKVSAQWKDLSQNLNGKFSKLLQASANPRNFVDSILTKSPTKTGIAQNIEKILSGLDKESKDALSQSIFNNVIDSVKSLSRDPATGGKALENFLNNWEPTGLLQPNHVAMLDSYAKMMQSNFEGFSNNMRSALGMSTSQGMEQAATEAQDAVEKATAKQALYSKALESLKGKQVYTANSDGTFDFSGLKKVLEKTNEGGANDAAIAKLNKLGDLTNMEGSALKGLFKGVFGTGLVGTGHPFIGASYLRSALSDLVGKPAERITSDDLVSVMDDMVSSGETSKAQKFLLHMVSGDYEGAASALGKAAVTVKNAE